MHRNIYHEMNAIIDASKHILDWNFFLDLHTKCTSFPMQFYWLLMAVWNSRLLLVMQRLRFVLKYEYCLGAMNTVRFRKYTRLPGIMKSKTQKIALLRNETFIKNVRVWFGSICSYFQLQAHFDLTLFPLKERRVTVNCCAVMIIIIVNFVHVHTRRHAYIMTHLLERGCTLTHLASIYG